MTLQARIEALASRIANHLRDAVMPRLLPAGGASGQVLRKTSNADHAVGWATASAGGTIDSRRVIIDFGASAAPTRSFDVPAPGASPGQIVIAAISAEPPPGGSAEDALVNPVVLSAACSEADVVRIQASSPGGYGLVGPYAVNLILG